MRRLSYATPRERKRDQLFGFVAFPVVNGVLYLATSWLLAGGATTFQGEMDDEQFRLVVLLLPWVVNGLLLALSLVFRPQMAIGYLACLSGILILGIALGALFLLSCFAALAVGIPTSNLAEDLGGFLTLLVFFGLMLAGVVFFGWLILHFFKDWWSSDDETPEEAQGEAGYHRPEPMSEGDEEEEDQDDGQYG